MKRRALDQVYVPPDAESGPASSGYVLTPAGRRTRRVSAPLRRIAYYLFGGGLLFLVLMIFARALEPADGGTQAALAPLEPLEEWTGTWEGVLRISELNGSVVRQVLITRSFQPAQESGQRFDFIELIPGGTRQVNSGVQERSGNKLTRRFTGTNEGMLLEGSRDATGAITWHCHLPGETLVLREWVNGLTFYVEGFRIPTNDPTAMSSISARLDRRLFP